MQPEGERFQDLIDELIHGFGSERRVACREEGQTECHGFLTRADLLAAIDIK